MPTSPLAKSPPAGSAGRGVILAAAILIVLGMGYRASWMQHSALWCDEAESAVNGLTILQTGLPGWKYLGLPVYENTLTERWDEHPEYEFRDSSYSKRGLVVYHGWLPLYSIAASLWVFGITPDLPQDPPVVLHGSDEVDLRTLAPRAQALVYSFFTLLFTFLAARRLGGSAAGLSALGLMALSAQAIDFGFQSRYYAATLCFNAFAGLWLLRAAKLGGWKDFLGLGLASALLFHTHFFSILVFAIVGVAALPFFVRHRHWFWKSALGASLAAALVLPWIVLSGFLETASNVPKVYKLFDSWVDVLVYAIDRPLPLALLFIVSVLLVISKWRAHWLPERIARPLSENGGAYTLLLLWLVAAYAAFHVVVPAASFFYERLSLTLWTPFVLLVGLFLCDLVRGTGVRTGALLALALALGFLAVRGRLAFFEESAVNAKRQEVAALVDALQAKQFAPGTKLYATPNDHLTITYYTGMPVQSIAPIRREFLNSYPHPVVYIETQMDAIFADGKDLIEAAGWGGFEPTDEVLWNLNQTIWIELSNRDLAGRGLPIAEMDPLPSYLAPYADKTHYEMIEWRAGDLEFWSRSPMIVTF